VCGFWVAPLKALVAISLLELKHVKKKVKKALRLRKLWWRPIKSIFFVEDMNYEEGRADSQNSVY
jgi:hypothetical protein